MTFPSDFDGVEVILEPDCSRAIKSDMTHITSCKNVISIENTASAVFFCCLFVSFVANLPFKGRNSFTRLSQKHTIV